ncbi:MAG: hypothetical protein ABR987_16560 [Terracidiphilus sp.]
MDTLTSFELSLLILSAYLHDIGMTPEFNKVNAHYDYLLAGGKNLLTGDESTALQIWLDDKGYQVVPPISDGIPSAGRLALAREITTYYCRDRHNDWSGEWIRAHLAGEPLSNYSGWIDDLVLLCQSHHFGLEKLTQPSFKARWVASPPEVVNLRYLALVLRMADILEFDPERTPEIILQHRDVIPESQIYWWKDKEITLTLSEGKVVITARPGSAQLHRAIEETMEAVDVEMALCRKIADDSPLGALPGGVVRPYPWELAAACHRDVEPRDGSYEYINGAFRPDTKKLLSILSGTALYRTPLDAVRELVQNAFDAVAERIAYLKLNQPDPASKKLDIDLREMHRASLQFEMEGDDAYLVCTDNGIGMTKTIITERVLVTASSPRHDVRALERRCNLAGFDLGRSGQFGIGILSYFMIATSVEIETFRAQEAGDSDYTKWHFETGGVGTFGELTKAREGLQGTRVRLRLNRSISSDPASWYTMLREYLVDTLVYCPCQFHLSSPIPECPPLGLAPGWSPRDYSERILEEIGRGRNPREDQEDLGLLKTEERERRLAAKHEIIRMEEEIRNCLHWRIEEGTLPEGLGRYEIRTPYFRLPGGPCLAFIRTSLSENSRLAVRPFLNGTHYRMQGEIEEAWRGMAVVRGFDRHWANSRRLALRSWFVRINWVSNSAGEIMANRTEFVSKGFAGVSGSIHAHIEKILTLILEEFKDSPFAWLNARMAERMPNQSSQCRWISDAGQEEGSVGATMWWEEVRFPAVSRSAFGYTSPEWARKLGFRGKPIRIIPLTSLSPESEPSDFRGVGWNPLTLPPDRIVVLETWRTSFVPLWIRRPVPTSPGRWLESKFPPKWKDLCGARFIWYAGNNETATVWNPSHPLVKKIDPSGWEWATQTFKKSIDPIPRRDDLLSDPAKAASWLLQCVDQGSNEIWDGLPERDPLFLPDVLRMLLPSKGPVASLRILFWVEDASTNSRLRVLTSSGWNAVRRDDVWRFIQRPSVDWRIILPKPGKSD